MCHQLDYATSGVMVHCCEKKEAGRIQRAFQDRIVKKVYLAVSRTEVDHGRKTGTLLFTDAPVASKKRGRIESYQSWLSSKRRCLPSDLTPDDRRIMESRWKDIKNTSEG